MAHKHSLERFINESNKKFNNKFDYSQTHYLGANTPIDIICPVHGKFQCTPWNHKKSKHGCDRCGTDAMAAWQKQQTQRKFEEFKKEAPGHYDYSTVAFECITDKITVICKEHGPFSLTLDHHLRGVGCKRCSDINKKGGYTESLFKSRPEFMDLPGILYMIQINDQGEHFIKIGITRTSVKQRYRASPYAYTVIQHWYMPLYRAFLIETEIKALYRDMRFLNKRKIWPTESFNPQAMLDIIKFVESQLPHERVAPFSPSSDTVISTARPG